MTRLSCSAWTHMLGLSSLVRKLRDHGMDSRHKGGNDGGGLGAPNTRPPICREHRNDGGWDGAMHTRHSCPCDRSPCRSPVGRNERKDITDWPPLPLDACCAAICRPAAALRLPWKREGMTEGGKHINKFLLCSLIQARNMFTEAGESRTAFADSNP